MLELEPTFWRNFCWSLYNSLVPKQPKKEFKKMLCCVMKRMQCHVMWEQCALPLPALVLNYGFERFWRRTRSSCMCRLLLVRIQNCKKKQVSLWADKSFYIGVFGVSCSTCTATLSDRDHKWNWKWAGEPFLYIFPGFRNGSLATLRVLLFVILRLASFLRIFSS